MKNLPAKFLALSSVAFAAVVAASCIFVEQNVEENNYAGVPTIGSNWVAVPSASSVVCDENISCCLLTPSDLDDILILDKLDKNPTLKAGSVGVGGSSGAGGNAGTSGHGGIGGATGLPGFMPILF